MKQSVRTFRVMVPALAAVSITAVACSFLLDVSDNQCNVDADCAKRGGPFASLKCVNKVCAAPSDASVLDATKMDDGTTGDAASAWACLGNVPTPVITVPKVNVKVPLIDLVAKMPVTNMSGKVCSKNDIQCATPRSEARPDSQGIMNLSLDAGFDGFLLLTPDPPDAGMSSGDASSKAGDAAVDLGSILLPSAVFFNPPIVQDVTYGTIVLVNFNTVSSIAAANGVKLDPSLGAVFMTAIDCTFKPAAGVAIDIDSKTATSLGFYFVDGLPSPTAPSTDVTGYAGFINVPTGTRAVTGALTTEQQKFIGRISVFAQAGIVTYTTLAPSPP